MKAILDGGPGHGLEVEVIGQYHSRLSSLDPSTPPSEWTEARYAWEFGPGESVIGRFTGYYTRSGRKVKEPS